MIYVTTQNTLMEPFAFLTSVGERDELHLGSHGLRSDCEESELKSASFS